MKRYYFIGDDLNVIATAERALLTQGRRRRTNSRAQPRRRRRRTAATARCAVADEARRHPLRRNRRADRAWPPRSPRIAIAQFTRPGGAVGWVPFVFLAIVLLGFFTWEGGLIGIQLPNSRFRRFEKALRAGEHVFFVDVDTAEEDMLRQVMAAFSSLRPAGTGSSSPRWLVGMQQNARKFSQWAP